MILKKFNDGSARRYQAGGAMAAPEAAPAEGSDEHAEGKADGR